jgi:hypothetical protein
MLVFYTILHYTIYYSHSDEPLRSFLGVWRDTPYPSKVECTYVYYTIPYFT